MKFTLQNIIVLNFLIVFMIGLGSSITINLQYGVNSTFNEIEHTDKNPTNTLNELIEEHSKLCQDLLNFDFSLVDFSQQIKFEKIILLKEFNLSSNPTPPPELIS